MPHNFSLSPHKNRDHYLKEESSQHVEEDIANAGGSRGQEALVKLVKTCGEQRQKQRKIAPANVPPIWGRRESRSPGKKGKEAEQAVAHEVGRLPNQKMQGVEVRQSDPGNEYVNDLPKDVAGMFGGESVGRKCSQQAQPEEGGHPVPQLLARRQLKMIGDGRDRQTLLLHPIVGSFAGDDHVVHVAFAQAGAADASETRFLLQFGDVPGPAHGHP